jgi:hypothetical protein
MRRILLSVLTIVTLSSCVAHEPDRRDSRHGAEYGERAEYRDRDGHPYRHTRWHDEDVYRREDGHWYSRRNNDWVMRPEINIE